MLWTRPDQISLKLCEYRYCLYNGELDNFQMHPLGSLGMGWAYIVIPLVIGILIGGLCIYALMLRVNRKNKENGKTKRNKKVV